MKFKKLTQDNWNQLWNNTAPGLRKYCRSCDPAVKGWCCLVDAEGNHNIPCLLDDGTIQPAFIYECPEAAR